MAPQDRPQLPVSPKRVQSDLEDLARFTERARPYTRLAFTPEYKEACAWLVSQMRGLGMQVRIDAAANIIGRRRGSDPAAPALMTGSHIDTVPDGGRFDGIAGVVGGLEVVRCLNELAFTTRHPLEVVAFMCEEASVLGLTPFGSRAMAGTLDLALVGKATTPLGEPLARALAALGGDADRLAEARLRPSSVLAQVELHVEQGPELEAQGLPVGVVTAIAGPNRGRITVTGQPDHAGAASMTRRRDAMAGAAELVLTVERIARGLPETVGTVGQLQVTPNQANVVPGQVTMSVEVRSASPEAIDTAMEQLRGATEEAARKRGLEVKLRWLATERPVVIPDSMRQAVEASCRELGIPFTPIISRASHDSARLAGVLPVAMVFVPSRQGRSHCPEEWTDYEQIAVGTKVLGHTLLKLDLG